MEGLTPEQAAQAAQWGPDIGPPGPVSYILHVLMSQEQDAAISGQSPEGSNAASGSANESPASGAPADSQPTPTSTFDNVSSSTTAPSTFETSASTPSTTQETTSSAPASASDTPSTSQDTSSSFSTDPATTSSSRPQFSPSTTTFSVSATSTGISYDPIGGSISYDPATSSIDSSPTSSSSSSTSPTPAGDFGAESTGSSSSSMANMSNAHKKAIVGGLAGAIGALVIVGLLLCFCLRRRHKRGDEEDDDEEDGLKKPVKPATKWNTAPSTVRLWSDLALGRAPGRSTPEISKPRTPSPADGNVIRVSTEHWSRPFRTKEGLRDSLEPEPLRVVNANPGSSRSSTPQDERRPGFVRKQRSALAAFLQDGARSNSRNAVKRGPISYPKPMPGDPVYSSKATVDSGADNQSLGSLPSNTSSPMVVQKPPEDPFMASSPMLTTMEEVMPPMEQARPRQKAPTQERTVSHFGKNANPFRNQIVPSVALPPRIFSYSNPNMRASNVQRPTIRRSSIGSTYSQKTRRDTAATTTMPRESDQFDLMISPDQMPPASGILAKTQEFEERQQDKKEQQQREKDITPSVESSPNWVLYEGT